jgi:hypothetical protein
LAMNPEPAPLGTPSSWSYFCSTTYATDQMGYSDRFPRAWAAMQSSVSGYTTVWN